MSHTPGPWIVRQDPTYPALIEIVTADNTIIIDAFFKHDVQEAANARLIAAAPELLEAITMAFHLIADGEAFSADHPWNKDATLSAIKSAVAKATEDKS